ncbi:MAG TPA: hypothetical protein VNA16_11355 [Abditibacteriaceae bacterium]|nr:hypothetical protein [Abditibacteriaceae bacterium]
MSHQSQTYTAEKGLPTLRWTRKNIVAEIRRLHGENAALNYSSVEANYLYLVRAASWHYGSWRRAIEAAGLEYESLAKYQRWDRKRIIARIRELHAAGVDLSWRSISQEIDPRLAAAALRANGFLSWRAAIAAAGLDIDAVAHYKYWTPERVLREIKAYHKAGHALSSKAMQDRDQSLFCAARRRFGSWDNALVAAGFEVAAIRLRQPSAGTKKDKARTLPGKNAGAKRGATASAQPARSKSSRKSPSSKSKSPVGSFKSRSGAARSTAGRLKSTGR